jgi:hypothetical protein
VNEPRLTDCYLPEILAANGDEYRHSSVRRDLKQFMT